MNPLIVIAIFCAGACMGAIVMSLLSAGGSGRGDPTELKP